ncbi:hypothetical protein [Streptomyces sp. 2231.1]|uniref:hypothetical protein n=1 Tax=Streptomyces sp. 2231.1 TaxID=1855347 RepID=UPI00115FB551|nr:hypothetical protein [Streptomyces sp. 2231.1]
MSFNREPSGTLNPMTAGGETYYALTHIDLSVLADGVTQAGGEAVGACGGRGGQNVTEEAGSG